MITLRRQPRETGQILALFALGLITMIGMIAFVVDGGNAFAQQRITQNGTDAAAEAGATVLAQRLGGATKTDRDVIDAITAIATAGDMEVANAEYTDVDGNLIGVTVGSLGGAAPPSGASGVEVTGRRPFGTYFARALGINQFRAVTEATAVTGFGRPVRTTLLPVTPPVNILTCDGQNNPAFVLPPAHWGTNVFYKVPLCKNGPGNVGWIDWTPPGGGASELTDVILDPSGTPEIPLPSWQYVTETGNVNSKPIEDALRQYDGQVVLIPLFDSTCNTEPTGTGIEGCPPANVGGNGQNQWYHFPEFAAFRLCDSSIAGCPAPHGAYINGNNSSVCDSGSGATSCLIGRFVNFIDEGIIGPIGTSPSPTKFIVVQLIK